MSDSAGHEDGVIQGICSRHLPYKVHEMHSARNNYCTRPAVTTDAENKPICAVHRGADIRAEQARQRAKDRYYARLGINPASMNFKD